MTANGGVSPRLWTSWWPTTPGRCSAPSRPGSRGERRSIIRVTSFQVSGVSGVRVWLWLLTPDPQVTRRRSSSSGITRAITGRSPTASAPPGSFSTWCGPRAWTVTTTPTPWGSGSRQAPTRISSSQDDSQCRLCNLSWWMISVQCFLSGSPGSRSRTSCLAQTRWCCGRTGSSSLQWWSSGPRLTSSSQSRSSGSNKVSLSCYNVININCYLVVLQKFKHFLPHKVNGVLAITIS